MRFAPGGTSLPSPGTLPGLRSRTAGAASPQHLGTVLPGEPRGSSLFPNSFGAPPAKHTVVETIRQAAVYLGLPTLGRFAEPFWGGHALRRGGAQYLGAAGVEVWRIQALARHSTS
eukprot:6802470-Alexandrium_andersonii.AAC.1